MASGFSVFISHVSEDETIAVAIKDFLERIFLNADVFVSGRDLTGGEVWIKEIKDKLRNATAIVSIITPFSEASPWVLFESGAGFLASKTIPLCADGVTLNGLRAPLKLLQARILTEEGLKAIVTDIARLAELRCPSEYLSLSVTLTTINDFLSIRSQSQKKDNEIAAPPADVKGLSSSLPAAKRPDSKILKETKRLRSAVRAALVSSIRKAEGNYDIPTPEQLSQMTIKELLEVAICINVPFPMNVLLNLLQLDVQKVPEDASQWKKMNAMKALESAFSDLEKFEKSL